MTRSSSSRSSRHAGFKPSIEALESRWCPSGASIQVLPGGALVLHGDSVSDQMTVVDDGKGVVSASIATPHGTVSGGFSNVRAITIEAGGGNDRINFSLGNQLTTPLCLTLCLGKGSDVVGLDFTAGIRGSSSATRLLNVQIQGGSGLDQVTSTFGAISGAGIRFHEELGSGNDQAAVRFNGALSGADADVTVNGGAGSEMMSVGFAGVSNSSVCLTENLGSGAATTSSTTFSGPISASHTEVNINAGRANGSMSLSVGEVDGGRLSLKQCQGDGRNMSSTVAFRGPLNGTALTANLEGDEAGKSMTMSFGAITGGSVKLSDDLGDGATSTNHVNFNGAITSATVSVEADFEPGKDAFFVLLGNVTNSTVAIEGCLGSGDARFEADLTGSLVGSKVAIGAHGKGTDHSILNARGVNVDAASELSLAAGSDKGTTIASLVYEGVMSGKLNVSLDGGRTGNTESASVTLDAGSKGAVKAVEDGGAGNDTLTLDVFDHSGGTLKSLSANLYEHGGHNTVSATSNVKVHA
jgi:hypothetical protein